MNPAATVEIKRSRLGPGARLWGRLLGNSQLSNQPIKDSMLAYRFFQGAFWSVSGAVVSRGLTLLASIVAGRMLGVQAYGELGIIQSTAGMFGTVAGLGLGLTATKHVAEFRNSDPAKAGQIAGTCYRISFIAGVIAALALVALAPAVATTILASPQLGTLLRESSGLILLGVVTGVQMGILAGFESFKSMAHVNVLGGVISFAGIILGVGLGGLRGGIWGLTGSLLVTSALNHSAIQSAARLHQSKICYFTSIAESSNLARFSIYVLVGALMGTPVSWVCNSLLVNQPFGYEQMGVFNAANQWRIIILFLPGTLGGVILPMMANLHGQGDQSRFGRMIRYSVLLNGGIAFLIALPLIFFSAPILDAYGPGFKSGQFAFVLLAIAAVILSVNNGLSRAILSAGAMRVDLCFHIIWGAVFLALGFTLIPRYGLSGVAVATIVGATTQGLTQWCWLFYKRSPLPADSAAPLQLRKMAAKLTAGNQPVTPL